PAGLAVVEERPVTEIAERIAAPIHKLMPPSAAEARKLQKLLMHAGHRSQTAPVIYRALPPPALVLFPGAVAVTFAFMGWSLKSGILLLVAAFLLGTFVPRFVL